MLQLVEYLPQNREDLTLVTTKTQASVVVMFVIPAWESGSGWITEFTYTQYTHEEISQCYTASPCVQCVGLSALAWPWLLPQHQENILS